MAINRHFITQFPSALVLSIATLLLAACSKDQDDLRELNGSTMGTHYRVKLSCSSEVKNKLHGKIEQLLQDFDKETSNWNPDSWISRFNQAEHTEWISASTWVIEILNESKEVHQLSGAALEVSISPLIELWGFGLEENDAVPSDRAIGDALEKIGLEKLEIDTEACRIRKLHPELQLNCSAIAKGYAVDLIAELLVSEGIEHFMVDIGGEIRVQGHAPAKPYWTVGIRSPEASKVTLHKKLYLSNQAIATSGNYANYFIRDGVRYSHVLNPKTGRPVEHKLCSVTVIGDRCSTADALATACLVLGTQQAKQIIESLDGYEAYFIEKREDGSYRTTTTVEKETEPR